MSSLKCGQFSDRNLTVQAAVALACGELGISEADFAGRECIAALMEPLAKSGPVSIDRLKDVRGITVSDVEVIDASAKRCDR